MDSALFQGRWTKTEDLWKSQVFTDLKFDGGSFRYMRGGLEGISDASRTRRVLQPDDGRDLSHRDLSDKIPSMILKATPL